LEKIYLGVEWRWLLGDIKLKLDNRKISIYFGFERSTTRGYYDSDLKSGINVGGSLYGF
jgi:hypothetical protein